MSAPHPSPVPAPSTRRTAVDRPRERLLGVAAGVSVVVGSLGPWATFGPFTKSGTSGDGVLTLVIGLLVLTAIGLGRMVPGVLVAGVIVAAIGVVDTIDVAGAGGPLSPSPGWGVLLTAAAGVAVAAWAAHVLLRDRDRRSAVAAGTDAAPVAEPVAGPPARP